MPGRRAASGREDRIVLDQELYTVAQAAAALHIAENTVKRAIKSGALPAFIPGSRSNISPGRGFGYRIKAADLQTWYFGPNG
jgi:excisionase family DNA binding protein